MSTINELEKEINRRTVHKVPIVEKLANKGYKFRDVANTPKSHFTKKRKRYKKKKK